MLTATALAGPVFWHGAGIAFFPFFLIPTLWIVLIVVLFAVFGRRFRRRAMAGGYGSGFGTAWAGGSRRAEVTLAERFAKGDIDEQEYRARLEVLRANHA